MPLREKQILEIGIQVSEGLAAAHEKGIVHRDIKPENIMVRKDGIIQIMDFGLAKLRETSRVSRLTKAGTTMGTMGYMSPEQVQGFDVDYRTDIFSLGVVLYELLAGKVPFKGVYETAIMYEIVNVDPPPLSALKQNINPVLDKIIMECLEKDKDERRQSAKELAKDLRNVKKLKLSRQDSTAAANSDKTEDKNSGKASIFYIAILNHNFDLTKLFKVKYIQWVFSFLLLLIIVLLLTGKNNSRTDNFLKFLTTYGAVRSRIISRYFT